jgi:geranylgeranyl diphosphate synthase, type I
MRLSVAATAAGRGRRGGPRPAPPAGSVSGVTSAVDRAGLRHRVEKALAAFLAQQRAHLASVDPAMSDVADALDAFVLGGGKRLRPAFAYWGFRGAGGQDSEQVVSCVAALELVQASALIHDDVMDASDLRRGEPAMHRRFATAHRGSGWHGDPDGFGTAAAILLGDLCLIWSDELLGTSGMEPAVLERARPVFHRMRTEVTAGQYLDIHTQATADTTLARASKVARFKAGKYTVEHPLLLGAALAGAPDTTTTAYSGYGLRLGEAFQLRDDVLGVFGDPRRTGKPAGDDLREGKRTYLVAAALQAAAPAARRVLTAGIGDPDLDPDGVARLREIITTSGALARTEHRITELVTGALAALTAVRLDTEAVEVLQQLATAATVRAG